MEKLSTRTTDDAEKLISELVEAAGVDKSDYVAPVGKRSKAPRCIASRRPKKPTPGDFEKVDHG